MDIGTSREYCFLCRSNRTPSEIASMPNFGCKLCNNQKQFIRRCGKCKRVLWLGVFQENSNICGKCRCPPANVSDFNDPSIQLTLIHSRYLNRKPMFTKGEVEKYSKNSESLNGLKYLVSKKLAKAK